MLWTSNDSVLSCGIIKLTIKYHPQNLDFWADTPNHTTHDSTAQKESACHYKIHGRFENDSMVEFEGAHPIGHGGGAFFSCSRPPGRETAGLHVPGLQFTSSAPCDEANSQSRNSRRNAFLETPGGKWTLIVVGAHTDFQRRTARCVRVSECESEQPTQRHQWLHRLVISYPRGARRLRQSACPQPGVCYHLARQRSSSE